MNQMGQQMQNAMNTPPPMPGSSMFHVYLNNQQAGPFDIMAIQQMVQSGQITATTQVWTQGMPQWAQAQTVPELSQLFQTPPPMGGTPPPMGNGSVPPPVL